MFIQPHCVTHFQLLQMPSVQQNNCLVEEAANHDVMLMLLWQIETDYR
jgi:hypothetical protein